MSTDRPAPQDANAPRAAMYRLQPTRSQHEDASRQWIGRCASAVPGEQVLVLGAGLCSEIPLAHLVEHFDRVVLNDRDTERLTQGIDTAALGENQREKIELSSSDLTGLVEPVAAALQQAVWGASEAPQAVRDMSAVLEHAPAGGLAMNDSFDLVVASCLLSQLHVELAHRAGAMFERTFPEASDMLSRSPDWLGALSLLARRMETRFVDDLARVVKPGGLVYLSESVQMCYVEQTPDGWWQSAGTYRMLRTKDLADYVTARFTIAERGRWQWVVHPPQAPGQIGRLFDVQALVLHPANVPAS